MDLLENLLAEIQPLRLELLAHPVYSMIDSVPRLRRFMEHHVFAVWDFMSLLKCLQQSQTSVDVPWRPCQNPISGRFINEIVLGEESDEDGSGGYTSHFELYRRAMQECGASTEKIDDFLRQVGQGTDLIVALNYCGARAGVLKFVQTTFSFVSSNRPAVVAAAFTFGREDVIPEMFRRCVASLAADTGTNLSTFRYYLDRHIALDEERHAPMAIKVMHEICGSDQERWREATEAARSALKARIFLWDGIVKDLEVPEDSLLLRGRA